ncbi:helix-turn-helix transcriptional regulator [Streptomyces sp. NPDC102381]|uniref:helix-turn-helix transcriptional regulator n=1 Tax=Streptomyces sp. NPDC102381 TaxID=3366164 RepID=UPI0037FFE687
MQPTPNKRHARHTSIVHLLRCRTWVSATLLAHRFDVSERTIYRDIEEIVSHGVPVESVVGRNGGFRLSADTPIDSLVIRNDDALRLYILGMIGDETAADESGEVGQAAKRTLQLLASRIYFDTSDWYWRDEASGSLAALRNSVMGSTAVEIKFRSDQHATTTLLKPYGLAWKSGEWWLVAAPPQGPPRHFQVNTIERVIATDLKFIYPADFSLKDWWRQALEDFGRGSTRVSMRISPDCRGEMLRLDLKPDSEVQHNADGTTTIALYVDDWAWLIPIVASFGSGVAVEEPTALQQAIRRHHKEALQAYSAEPDSAGVGAEQSDETQERRIWATRGRYNYPPRVSTVTH